MDYPLCQIDGFQLLFILLLRQFLFLRDIDKRGEHDVFLLNINDILEHGEVIFAVSHLFSMDVLMGIVDPLEIRRIDKFI